MELWIIFAISSALVMGLRDILIKKFESKNVTPNQIIFEEQILVLFFLFLFFLPQIEFSSFKDLWFWYLLKAFSVWGASLFYFDLLKRHDITLVSPLLNLSPLFLLFFSSIYLLEAITMIQFIGILIIVFSVYFLEVVLVHHKENKPHEFHFKNIKKTNVKFFLKAVALLIVISIAAIADKVLLSQISIFSNFFYTSLIGLVVLGVYYIKHNELQNRFKSLIHEPETFIISVFGIISSFLILLAIAIPAAMVSLIIPLRRTSTLFSSFFGGLLFHEKHLTKKFIAIIFMLIGIILIVL